MRRKTTPRAVIRSQFPTVAWYAPNRHYRIDARAKGGTQHSFAHRDEALALADQIAADYESKGKAAFSDPSLHEELLKALGTNPQEIIALWLRTHSETNGSKPTGEAFDEFGEFKQRSMRTEQVIRKPRTQQTTTSRWGTSKDLRSHPPPRRTTPDRAQSGASDGSATRATPGRLTVNLAPVSRLDHDDHQLRVLNLVDDPVISLTNSAVFLA